MLAGEAVAAAVEAHPIVVARVLACGRHNIDRTTQQSPAKAQCVAAAIDLGKSRDQGVDRLAVAEAVSLVERQTVLGDQKATNVAAVTNSRTPDRNADIAAPFALCIDARRVAQHVVETDGKAVLIGLSRDDRDAAGGFREALASIPDNGGIFGIAGTGDDDGVNRGGGVFRPRQGGHERGH